MKQSTFKIQIIQTFFVGILFAIALLQKNNIINTNKSFIAFYIISILIYWIIMSIGNIVFMHKNKNEGKMFFINLISITVELIVLGIFCGSIDSRIDKIEFMKHCKETTATVYDINKKQVRAPKRVGETDKVRFQTNFDYFFEYYANGERYSSSIYEVIIGYMNEKASYKTGDTFTIYYNTENPEDWRRDIKYASENTIIILTIIIIVLRVFQLVKAISDYKSIKKIENEIYLFIKLYLVDVGGSYMKKLYGDILKVVAICAIITFVCVELALVPSIFSAYNAGNSRLNDAKTTMSSSETLNDMQGWGVVYNGVSGTLGKVAAAILLLFCIVSAGAIILYVTLYFISWRLFNKSEDKNKAITSLVLTGIACFIQLVIIFEITKTNMSSFNVSFLIADISEIISVILTLIIVFLNRNKIKEVCSNKIAQ